MSKKKTVLLGILLIICAVIVFIFGIRNLLQKEKAKTPSPEPSQEQATLDYDTEDLMNYNFKINGMSEEAYTVLGFQSDRMAEFLKTWTYENGYSRATSATFFQSMAIDFNEHSYTMQCELDDEEKTVITVIYLQKRDLLTAHP